MKLRPAMEKLFSKEFHQKAQSAMEYLMTYGWAILIIAVVLGALFQLGVFNANNFAPKAPPGACQVFRPNGPGTTSFINLEGVCSGELPQYVASFSGSSYVTITSVPILAPTSFTVTAWVNPSVFLPPPGNWMDAVTEYCGAQTSWILRTSDTGDQKFHAIIQQGSNRWDAPTHILNTSKWYFLGMVSNGLSISSFYNGNYLGSTSVNSITSTAGNIFIGSACNGGEPFIGQIANVQIYNTSLSTNEVQALYQEGIGGAPIDLQNLVGWWPLNGNANDYSGNGNNGQATAVTYTGSWTSGYTPP
jgi:hypothetical protein